MPGGAVEPGRYAQRPDGTWQKFTDKAELGFVPLACVTVKAPKPVERDEPIVAVPKVARAPRAKAAVVRRAPPASGRSVSGKAKAYWERGSLEEIQRDHQRGAVPLADGLRTATPADVFRAVADEFGILSAMGQSRSRARFKPLVKRDDDADAAAAYERAIEERQGRH